MNRLVALAFTVATVVATVPGAHAGGAVAGAGGASRPDLQGGRVTAPAVPPSTAVPPSPAAAHHPAPHHRVGPPHRVIFVPVFVAPSYSCVIPGYWTYQWIPQTYWYNVWVPAAYTPDWDWIAGHYEQRPYATGSYQPLWMPARYLC